LIASRSLDETIQIWSLKTGLTNRTINAGSDVYSLQLLTNGIYLAVGRLNRDIRIYNINTGGLIATLTGHVQDFVYDLVLISTDLLASTGKDKTVRIWNLTTNTLKYNLTGHSESVLGLKLVSSDILASGSIDRTIKLWNIRDGTLIRTLTGHTGSISWSVDLIKSQILVSGGWESAIKLWNISTGELLNSLNTAMPIRALAVLNANITTGLNFLWLFSQVF